jgi:predicted  nucleic acid-binding Zn-ribbon protein
MRYRLKRAKRALKDKNAKIAELNGFINQRDEAITALESDLNTERDAAAGAIQEIRELRDDVSACRSPDIVLARFDRLLQDLKAP